MYTYGFVVSFLCVPDVVRFLTAGGAVVEGTNHVLYFTSRVVQIKPHYIFKNFRLSRRQGVLLGVRNQWSNIIGFAKNANRECEIVCLTMGVRVSGYIEEIYSLDRPLSIITLVVVLLSMLTTLSMLFVAYFTNFLGNLRFARLMACLLLISFIHHILTLCFLFLNTPPQLDWCLSFFGVLLIGGLAMTSTELLYFFASLTHFWNKKRVRIFQVFWFVFTTFCYIDGGIKLGYLGQETPNTYQRYWPPYELGVSIISSTASLYYLLQSLYIFALVYRHIRITKRDTLKLRIPKMIQFLGLVFMVGMIDVMGVVFYVIEPMVNDDRSMWTPSGCMMYFHAIGVCLVFQQLKYITIARDEEISGHDKKSVVMLLNARQTKSKSKQASVVQEVELKTVLKTVQVSRSLFVK